MNVTRIIKSPWIIPVIPHDTVLKEHAIVIENTCIANILPAQQAAEKHPEAETIELRDQIVLPGLINAHAHSPVAFVDMLHASAIPTDEARWPLLRNQVTATLVKDATMAAAMRMLAGGVTCCADTYFFPESVAEAMLQVGMRACIGLFVGDRPFPGVIDFNDAVQQSIAAHDKYKGDRRITFAFAPHSVATLSDRSLQGLRVIVDELNLRLHAHLHETEHEIEDCERQFDARPLERLRQFDALTPSLTAIHMGRFTDDEARLLKSHHCMAVRCPTYNGLFNRAARPERDLGYARVALGSHAGMRGCAFDLFGEMKRIGQPLAEFGGPTAAETLTMATINGARALGLHDAIGSLEKSKSADMIALDYPDECMARRGGALDFVTRVAEPSHVRHAWIGGRHVLRDGESTQVDELDLARALELRLVEQRA